MTISFDLTDDATRAALAARAAKPAKASLIGLGQAELARRWWRRASCRSARRRCARSNSGTGCMCAASPTLRKCSTSRRNCAPRSTVHFTIARPEIVEEQVSNDGTRKWLFRFPPRGAGRPVEIETVYIPEEGRGTLCISSPGRLHADLLVLPHRHAEAGAQPDRRRDPDPADDGARPARRLPRPRHAGRGDRAGRRPQDLQHRHDGHGRAALQFRGSEEGAADRLRR